MSQIPEIILPEGARSVAVSDIPRQIALALNPEQPESPYILRCLTKHVGTNPVQHSPPCESEELRLVAEIAGPTPLIGAPIAKDELDAYLTKFNTSPHRPEWTIGASVVNETLNANVNRMRAEDEHREALKKAIRAGSFVPLSNALVPLDETIREALDLGKVFVETFRDYASKFSVLVRVKRSAHCERTSIETAAHWLAGQTADERADPWFKDGRNNDMRQDIAVAMTETDIVHHALALAADGKLHPTNPVTGLPAGGAFTPDRTWELTESDFDLLTAYVRPIAVRKRKESQQDAERHDEGRYTLREAAVGISGRTGERYKALLARLVAAARNSELPVYLPGSNLKHQYAEPFRASAVCDFYEEARWNELNTWLEKYEQHVSYRFPNPTGAVLTPATPLMGTKAAANRPAQDLTPRKIDLLDAAIDEALERAPAANAASLFGVLREMALESKSPFTGEVRGPSLYWTDANGKVKLATQKTVGQRLNRRP